MKKSELLERIVTLEAAVKLLQEAQLHMAARHPVYPGALQTMPPTITTWPQNAPSVSPTNWPGRPPAIYCRNND